MQCPVCDTQDEPIGTICKICNWYFPLKDTPDFALELSRAKQQFQMASSFNQMFQHMQVQSKMLEKISFRLDDMEGQINHLKEHKPKEKAITQKYEYPKLAPIKKAEDFNTPEQRLEWWNALSVQWQKAFNTSVLQKNEAAIPSDEELKGLLESAVLRLVGPKGPNPSLSFELTDLSGVQHLTNLIFLTASHHSITDLAGIENLENLESLFVNNNQLTGIKALHYLPRLKQLYCGGNQITSLHPLAGLTALEFLHCCHNSLTSLEGITPQHAKNLKKVTCLPNKKIEQQEIIRMEQAGIRCMKG